MASPRVLVVDDDRQSARVPARLLRNDGFETTAGRIFDATRDELLRPWRDYAHRFGFGDAASGDLRASERTRCVKAHVAIRAAVVDAAIPRERFVNDAWHLVCFECPRLAASGEGHTGPGTCRPTSRGWAFTET